MRVEHINNKQVMVIGLVNEKCNEQIQLDALRPVCDRILFYSDSMDELNEQIRKGDSVNVYSYHMVHDKQNVSLEFKSNLEKNGIRIDSVSEKTHSTPDSLNNLWYNTFSMSYQIAQLINEYRVKGA